MNKRRLLKLADLLEADAKNKKGIRFNMGDWGTAPMGEEPAVSCGTTACAMGLAVASGAFKRAGLTNGAFTTNWIVPKVGKEVGFKAAEVLFDIDIGASYFLFDPCRYPTDKRTGATGERYVAKRIRDFVAGKVSP
jgi:hypothetical protein